jgi:hypothetical protein
MRKRIFMVTFMVAAVSMCIGAGLMGSRASAIDVLAPTCNNPNKTSVPEVCKDNNTTSGSNPLVGPKGIVTTYIGVLSLVVGLASVAMILIGALKYVTSNGDPQSIATAQKTVLYAIAGLFVAVVARILVTFVISRVGVG